MASEQQLIKTLSELGFNQPDLLSRLLRFTNLGLPSFTLKEKAEFGEAKVDFELFIKQSFPNNEYLLERYEAVFIRPLKIDHKNILVQFASSTQPIDTQQLEAKMSNIDWRSLPTDHSLQQRILHITRLLFWLEHGQDPDGRDIGRQLCIKYWTGTPFSNPVLERHAQNFTIKQVFTENEQGFPQPYLAYCFVSGKRAALLDNLERCGFTGYWQLDRKLREWQSSFDFINHRWSKEGTVNFTISIQRDKEFNYFASSVYSAKFTQHPAITHGVFHGVDTKVLEERIAGIDWMDEASHYVKGDGDECSFTEEISDIIDLLQNQLTADLTGCYISNQLQAKYWSASPDFEGAMDKSASEYFETLPSTSLTFSTETNIREAYNLMSGRPIYEGHGFTDPAKDTWLKVLVYNQGQGAQLTRVPGMAREKLESLVKGIPVADHQVKRIIDELLKGNLVNADLRNGKTIQVEVTPDCSGLKLTDELGRRIYANLAFESGTQNTQAFRPFLSESRSQKKGRSNLGF